MRYRANKHATVKTMKDKSFLIQNWEVVELVLQHKGKSIIRFNGNQMYVDKSKFHRDFDLIPERIGL